MVGDGEVTDQRNTLIARGLGTYLVRQGLASPRWKLIGRYHTGSSVGRAKQARSRAKGPWPFGGCGLDYKD